MRYIALGTLPVHSSQRPPQNPVSKPVRREILAGLRCERCGGPVDPMVPWPDPKSGTVGHIIARAEGGTNERSNLRLEHLGCNNSDGSRIRRSKP